MVPLALRTAATAKTYGPGLSPCDPESTPTVMSNKFAMFMSCPVGEIYVHIHVASCVVRRRKSWHYVGLIEEHTILMAISMFALTKSEI